MSIGAHVGTSAALPRRACSFLVPGDWQLPTGGYGYDRRIAQALPDAGWQVEPCRLDGAWPWPDLSTRSAARAQFAAWPDGSIVVADGLAFGALPDEVRAHAQRLRWVALVHHPLHLETGIGAEPRRTLAELERQALQAARHVIVTSAATANDVAQLGVDADRIAVVEPGTDAVASSAPKTPRFGTPVRLLCVATLTPRKGHAALLEALASLKALDWELHAVGSADRDPPSAEHLHALAASLGLAGRVHWHGEVGPTALAAHYAQADAFVLASWHEGYGMAVAEALAHGLPALCTRAGALAQTLPTDAGLQVSTGDPQALREALARLITDADLRATLAAGARRAARNLPTWPQAAARFAAVLDGVAA